MKKKLQNNSKSDLLREIDLLKVEIQKLKERNKEKDADKAWETSWVRKALVALFTYFAMVILMGSIGVSEPFVNAIIPTLGFLLSTFSLSLFKRFWT